LEIRQEKVFAAFPIWETGQESFPGAIAKLESGLENVFMAFPVLGRGCGRFLG
jgi:hypothetical protein